MDRQDNGQMKTVHKDKQRSEKHRHKTKDWAAWTPLQPGVNSCAPLG
jgi:hypothetical protein